MTPLASIIVPVWRDERVLAHTIQSLSVGTEAEIIVAGALGEEPRYDALRRQHAIRWVSAPRGRAAQMNAGAAIARGRWLVFLHADSVLPNTWLEEIAEVDRREHVAGAFALRLASAKWQARVIEAGVRLRVALFGLPYGDQALFIRRDTFVDLGGYRDLPLMEDVDLVRRVKAIGPLAILRSVVSSSARRWEQDGWLRRSARNVALMAQFLSGASPSTLAQRYYRRKAAAVVIMARAPWIAGKTRLAVDTSDLAHAALREALFLDTLDAVTSIRDAEHIVACEPADGCERVREMVGPGIDVIAQRGDGLGSRIAHVFEDVFRLGPESVVVIGSDVPDVPPAVIQEALDALSKSRNRVVVGPASDGGYYLIGVNGLRPELFNGIDWSTPRVLDQTLDAAKSANLDVVTLGMWSDVDEADDLKQLISRPTTSATRTRAWAVQHLP